MDFNAIFCKPAGKGIDFAEFNGIGNTYLSPENKKG
jgi:hypothetical protein